MKLMHSPKYGIQESKRSAPSCFQSKFARGLRSSRSSTAELLCAGFTLLELMIVISMLLILLSIAVPQYRESVRRARESVLRQDLYDMRKLIGRPSPVPKTLFRLRMSRTRAVFAMCTVPPRSRVQTARRTTPGSKEALSQNSSYCHFRRSPRIKHRRSLPQPRLNPLRP